MTADIWSAPVGTPVDVGAGIELTISSRREDRGTVRVRLHGTDDGAMVGAEMTRTGVRSAPADGYLDGPLPVGSWCEAVFEVTAEMVTRHVPHTPPVLMTPTMIALLEEVAARIVRPRLLADAAAVGTFVGVHHTGAAALGERVRVRAEVVAHSGRRIHFEVAATVDSRPVGHGEIGFTLVARSPGQ